MIAFLIALAPFIPAVLSVVSFFIKIFGASQADLEAFEQMVQKCKDDGKISLESHDDLVAFKKQIQDEIEKEKNGDKPQG